MSPTKYIESFKPLKQPLNMYNKEQTFNYSKNKKEIRNNLKNIKENTKFYNLLE